ncbi:hypothetical protein N864_09685 [Intrasporangium chromatireducens Q5-1]|uniref:Uncharacterized protein n=1 Tax=Intrasporangium chromatireducens Q5-1 TaxID=584657 RepID=W9GQ89_9MICO|nr:hypothetical protein N864_09685 [Intrasporangium chromatireducens Q5-1]
MREPDELRAKAVARRSRVLLDEVREDERAEQPVHRRHGHTRAFGQVGEVLVGRALRQQLEQRHGVAHRAEPPTGLAAVGRLGHRHAADDNG